MAQKINIFNPCNVDPVKTRVQKTVQYSELYQDTSKPTAIVHILWNMGQLNVYIPPLGRAVKNLFHCQGVKSRIIKRLQ